MRLQRTAIGPTAALVLLIAGCGSSGSSSPGADPGTASSATADSAESSTPGSTAAPASSPASGGATVSDEIFDRRYCEVVPISTSGETVTQIIYNTLGLNNCPEEQWSALTEDIVNQEYGSQQSELNGPRHWLLDEIQQNVAPVPPADVPQTFTFGGIETAVRAKLEVPVGTAAVGTQYYTPNPVQRDTIWIYNKDRTLYQLTDPDGNVYVMQSYSQQIDPDLDLRSLSDLGSSLTLPAGWQFSTEKTSDQFNMVSGGTAYVIQDNLLNSYQMRTPLDTTGPAPTPASATQAPTS